LRRGIRPKFLAIFADVEKLWHLDSPILELAASGIAQQRRPGIHFTASENPDAIKMAKNGKKNFADTAVNTGRTKKFSAVYVVAEA
jgi:hypothetical protein